MTSRDRILCTHGWLGGTRLAEIEYYVHTAGLVARLNIMYTWLSWWHVTSRDRILCTHGWLGGTQLAEIEYYVHMAGLVARD